MDKRYQVFISSTFDDLKEERQSVIRTVMELECIPTGMELFPAADEDQWDFIKRVIDDCDYYIVIIGERYGSLTQEGISFTEKEYEYAVSRGLNILAFVHDCSGNLAEGKGDDDPDLQEKLSNFREKVRISRLTKQWEQPSDLPGLVATSLARALKSHPAVGWVRANTVSNQELLQDLNALRKENERLRADEQKSIAAIASDIPHLAGLDEVQSVTIGYTDYYGGQSYQKSETVQATWSDIFSSIAPDLLENPSDTGVNYKLGKALYRKSHPANKEKTATVSHDDFQTIKVQLAALGLVRVAYLQTTQGGMALFWSLTPRGNVLMVQLRTVKSTKGQRLVEYGGPAEGCP